MNYSDKSMIDHAKHLYPLNRSLTEMELEKHLIISKIYFLNLSVSNSGQAKMFSIGKSQKNGM